MVLARRTRAVCATLLPLLFAAGAPVQATVVYAGADLTTHGAWRTATVAKPLDANGDNVYGTDGYLLATSPGGALQQVPGYVSAIVNVAGNLFTGGAATSPHYTSVDNPTGSGTVTTGTFYASSANGHEDDLIRITLSAAASFRFGVLVDNHDFADISPSSMEVRQTVGGTATSGLQVSNLQPNLNSDWYFFDVTGVAGDVFVLSGVNWYNGSGPQASNGIGAVTFDSLSAAAVPEPASVVIVGIAVVALGAGQRRRHPAGRFGRLSGTLP